MEFNLVTFSDARHAGQHPEILASMDPLEHKNGAPFLTR